MNKGKGWYDEPIRHGLSGKRISTKKNDSYDGVKSIDKIEEGFGNDRYIMDRLLVHHCDVYAYFLHKYFDMNIYGVEKFEHGPFGYSHIVAGKNGKFYDAWGDDAVRRWKESLDKEGESSEIKVEKLNPDVIYESVKKNSKYNRIIERLKKEIK